MVDCYDRQAGLLKALAHPVRLQILHVLHDGEQCVCHLEATLGLRQAYVSQQLMVLRKAGLVADRKDGLRVYYRVLDPTVYVVLDIARSLVSRQAQRQGHAVSFALPVSTGLRPCHCPKCAQPVSLASAH